MNWVNSIGLTEFKWVNCVPDNGTHVLAKRPIHQNSKEFSVERVFHWPICWMATSRLMFYLWDAKSINSSRAPKVKITTKDHWEEREQLVAPIETFFRRNLQRNFGRNIWSSLRSLDELARIRLHLALSNKVSQAFCCCDCHSLSLSLCLQRRESKERETLFTLCIHSVDSTRVVSDMRRFLFYLQMLPIGGRPAIKRQKKPMCVCTSKMAMLFGSVWSG